MPTTTSSPILIYQPGGGVPVGPVSNPPVYSQADVTPLINGQNYIDVVFGSVQTDNSWVLVECDVVNTTDLSPLNIWPGIITNRTAAGFRVYLNGMPDSGNYYLHWAVSGVNIGPSPASTYFLVTGTGLTFTVSLPPSTSLSVPLTVTPHDGDVGGSFSPSTGTLTTNSRSFTFTYIPVSYGAITISTTNDSGLFDPAPIIVTLVAPTYTLSGPSTGAVGVASTNFTVTLSGAVLGTVTVTPSDAGGGGAFTPTTVALTTGSPSNTFTYTPASGGTKTISVTNNGGLVNPGNLSYVVYRIYYRSLTVDHTKVPSTQTDFPVLVSVTDATLKSIPNSGHVAGANGYDIGFFSDSAGTTPLKWEIEKWVATTGELVAWVKIASVSSSADTVFYIRYGDATIATDHSDKLNVWTNNFVSIYHLGNGTTLNVSDSLNAFNGTNNGTTAVAGQIDGGANFVSASVQYVDCGSRTGPPAFTLSTWIKATSFPGAYNAIVARNNVGTTANQIFAKSNGKLAIYILSVGVGSVSYDGTGSHTLTAGTWYYIVGTFVAGTGLTGYVNASVDGTAAGAGVSENTIAANARIGSDPFNSGREWNGVIDEVRLANVARSADWITTEFNNQNTPGTFITVGVET